VGVTSVRNNHELMLMSQDGTVIRVSVESVRCTGRNTMGVRVMNLRGADKVSGMARLVGSGNGGDGNGGNGLDGSDHGTSGARGRTRGHLDIEGDEDEDGEDLGGEEDIAE
jgi:DNA gyrase subunit A